MSLDASPTTGNGLSKIFDFSVSHAFVGLALVAVFATPAAVAAPVAAQALIAP
jgi:hypothetical protein